MKIILGRSNIKTTERYMSLLSIDLNEDISKFNSLDVLNKKNLKSDVRKIYLQTFFYFNFWNIKGNKGFMLKLARKELKKVVKNLSFFWDKIKSNQIGSSLYYLFILNSVILILGTLMVVGLYVW